MKKHFICLPTLFVVCSSLAQNVGIGTNTPGYTFEVKGQPASAISIYVNDMVTGSARSGIQSNIFTMSNPSAAVAGVAYDGAGSGVSVIEAQRYAVIGQTNTAIGVAGYTISGTALRGKTASGMALHTTGAIRLDNLGEGAGKLLTSDASGNASWQAPVVVPHNHFGESWAGSASTGLNISNTNAGGTGIRGSGLSAGVAGWCSSAGGYGVIGINNSSGNYHTVLLNSGVVGVAGDGTGVYAASVSGTSFHASKLNFGSSAGIVGLFENLKTGLTTPVVKISGISNQPALELSNGFLKVSGSTKTAFTVTATAANSSAHILNLSHPNQAANDILMVTHHYNPPGAANNYLTSPFGVYWNGVHWNIYLEDFTPILNKSFNVLVIKQ